MNSITLDVHLEAGQCGHRRLRSGKKPKHAKPAHLPRVTRLMALAIKFEELLASGVVDVQHAIANLAGVERSQISKILRLRLLNPRIQERLLELPEQEGEPIAWGDLDRIARIADWTEQEIRFQDLVKDCGSQ